MTTETDQPKSDVETTENSTIAITIQSISESKLLPLKDLARPQRALELLSDLKILSGKHKVNLRELVLNFGSHEEAITNNLRDAIMKAENPIAAEIWNRIAAEIKHAIIVPDDGIVDREIIRKLDIPGERIKRAFLFRFSYDSPKQTPYSTLYSDFTWETGDQLVQILNELSLMKPEGPMLIREFFEGIDIKLLYLIAVEELDHYTREDGSEDPLNAMFGSESIPPSSMHLLQWLYHHERSVFHDLITALKNDEWPELRAIFYELWERNKLTKNE